MPCPLCIQVCGHCKVYLPAARFHRSKSYNDGLYGKCKDCCATVVSMRKANHAQSGGRRRNVVSAAAVPTAIPPFTNQQLQPLQNGPTSVQVHVGCDGQVMAQQMHALALIAHGSRGPKLHAAGCACLSFLREWVAHNGMPLW